MWILIASIGAEVWNIRVTTVIVQTENRNISGSLDGDAQSSECSL